MHDWLEETFERRQAVWIAEVEDGSTWYQHETPLLSPHPAWLCLKEYCQTKSLAIVNVGLKFRSHEVWDAVPRNAEAYWFSRGAASAWGIPETLHFYLLGAVTNGVLTIGRWQVPELICLGRETRPIVPGDNLIEFPNRRNRH